MLALKLGLSLASSNGVGGSDAFLLDEYTGAAVAYSLRKLKSTTTNVVRVRRSSDNAELDFTATDITDGTLTTWTGANDGLVTVWYDQSGGENAVQITASKQPTIVSTGVVELMDGTPALNFDISDLMTTVTARSWSTAFINAQSLAKRIINYVLYNLGSGGIFWNGTYPGVDGLGVFDVAVISSLTGEDLLPHLGYFNLTGTTWSIGKDGATATDFTSGVAIPFKDIGRGDLNITGYVQDVILYTSTQSANRAAIEALL